MPVRTRLDSLRHLPTQTEDDRFNVRAHYARKVEIYHPSYFHPTPSKRFHKRSYRCPPQLWISLPWRRPSRAPLLAVPLTMASSRHPNGLSFPAPRARPTLVVTDLIVFEAHPTTSALSAAPTLSPSQEPRLPHRALIRPEGRPLPPSVRRMGRPSRVSRARAPCLLRLLPTCPTRRSGLSWV